LVHLSQSKLTRLWTGSKEAGRGGRNRLRAQNDKRHLYPLLVRCQSTVWSKRACWIRCTFRLSSCLRARRSWYSSDSPT